MSENTFLYFAYGSNLWTGRIHENNRTAVMKDVGLLKVKKLSLIWRIMNKIIVVKYN
jgi:hypothetical protein